MAVGEEFWRELENLRLLSLRDFEAYGHAGATLDSAEDVDRYFPHMDFVDLGDLLGLGKVVGFRGILDRKCKHRIFFFFY